VGRNLQLSGKAVTHLVNAAYQKSENRLKTTGLAMHDKSGTSHLKSALQVRRSAVRLIKLQRCGHWQITASRIARLHHSPLSSA
jgi:hypothetical protein